MAGNPPQRRLRDVRLTEGEVARMAAFKGMRELEFIQNFTRLTRDRRGLSLEEKADGSCIFLEGNDCSVQEVKPQQCRDFPNLWNFPGFEQVCRAIPRAVTTKEFQQQVLTATGRHLPPPADDQ